MPMARWQAKGKTLSQMKPADPDRNCATLLLLIGVFVQNATSGRGFRSILVCCDPTLQDNTAPELV